MISPPPLSSNFSPATLPRITTPEARQVLKNITHIYTDLDGTLFAPGGRLLAADDLSPSVATAQALVALRQANIEVIIVTGRNRVQGEEIMRLLNIPTFIGELGCVIQKDFGAKAQIGYALGDWKDAVLGEGLAPGRLPANTVPADLIRQSGVIEQLMEAFPGKFEVHNPYRVTREVTLPFRGQVDYEEARRILDACPLPLQLLDNGLINPLKHTLTDCSEIHVYHLMPRGTSKSQAVAADMLERGLSRSQTIAAGDAVGDMAMSEQAGSFVLINKGEAENVRILRDYEAYRKNDPDTEIGEDLGFTPVFITQGKTADGWAEFAQALLAAKMH